MTLTARTKKLTAGGILALLFGAGTLAAGSIPYGDGDSTLSSLAIGTAGTVMTSSGTAPQWSTSLALTSTIASKQTSAAGISLDHNSAAGNFTLRLSPATLGANRRWTFPDRDDTAAGLLAQTFAGLQTLTGGIYLNSGATPSDQQFTMQANALGGCGWLCYGADNSQLQFDCAWAGSALVARHTDAFSIVKSSGTWKLRGKSGLTIGNAFTHDTLLEAYPALSTGGLFVNYTTASTSTTTGGLVVAGGIAAGASSVFGGSFYQITINPGSSASAGLRIVSGLSAGSGGLYCENNLGNQVRFQMIGNGAAQNANEAMLVMTGSTTFTATQNGNEIWKYDAVSLRVVGTGVGLGYGTGAGGTVTQITSKATTVTLNKMSGQITMHNAALAAGAKVTFACNNTGVTSTDGAVCWVQGGGTVNSYRVDLTQVAAGTLVFTVENITGGSLSESPVIGFAVIKAVTA